MPLDILENLANLACQEGMVLLVDKVHKGQRVTQGLQVLVHQENQVQMVPLVCLDQWVTKVHRVLLVNQVLLACQVLARQVSLEFLVAEDPLVLQEQLVRKESPAPLVLLVNQVLLVLLVQLVHRVQEDSRVRQALKDQKVTSAW